jgi:hypothetical protein
MAKKKSEVKMQIEVEPSAGGYRRCPDCDLSFRHRELFDQHRSIGCKPAKSNGPTWSDKDPENETPKE